MPDLKADAARLRDFSAILVGRGYDLELDAMFRLADMADRLADTEGLVAVLQNGFVSGLSTKKFAQAVQDYVRGE